MDEKTLKKFYDIASDPAKLGKLTKKELVAVNELTERYLEDLAAQRIAVRAELLDKIEGDGEVIGKKTYTKVRIYTFNIELKKAKELGATKIVPEKVVPEEEVVDNIALKKLLMKGAKIKHDIVERLMIREIK